MIFYASTTTTTFIPIAIRENEKKMQKGRKTGTCIEYKKGVENFTHTKTWKWHLQFSHIWKIFILIYFYSYSSSMGYKIYFISIFSSFFPSKAPLECKKVSFSLSLTAAAAADAYTSCCCVCEKKIIVVYIRKRGKKSSFSVFMYRI